MVFYKPWLSFHSTQTHLWQWIFNAVCKAAALLMVCEGGGRTSTQKAQATPELEATQQKETEGPLSSAFEGSSSWKRMEEIKHLFTYAEQSRHAFEEECI